MAETRADERFKGTNEIGLPSKNPVVFPVVLEGVEEELKDPVLPKEICPCCRERTSKPGGPNPMVMFADKEQKDSDGKVLNPNRLMWVGCTRCLSEWAGKEPLRMLLLKVAWYHTTGCAFPKRKVSGGLAVQIDDDDK